MRVGARGPDVTECQNKLNEKGAQPALEADGIFGKRTKAAVISFQQQNHLAADGVVGPKTWGVLLGSPVKPSPQPGPQPGPTPPGPLPPNPRPGPTPPGPVPPQPAPNGNRAPVGSSGKLPEVGVYVVYQDSVRTKGTAAWRGNNPGNITHGSFTKSHGAVGEQIVATKHQTYRFAVFPDEKTGFEAIKALMKTEKYAKLSVADAMKRYAPASDPSNDPAAYAAKIKQETGIESTRIMNTLNGSELEAFAQAIRKVEGWKEGKTYQRGDASNPEWVEQLIGP